jgi:glycosyltransferase involved in cell wall biosynthesis
VIAVENGSSDESRQLAVGFTDRLNLHIVDAFRAGWRRLATSVGGRHGSGRKLIFIDADDEVTPGYVSAMAAGLPRTRRRLLRPPRRPERLVRRLLGQLERLGQQVTWSP